MKRIKPGQRGFTLVEMIFVLAIMLTLLAIFTPLAMDKLAQSKTAKAQADIDAIAAALTNFFSDFANFPSCEAADCDPLNDAANNLRFLAVGTGSGDLSAVYPSDTGALWSLTTQDDPTEERNNFHNHVVANNPNANGTVNEAGIDYKTTKWRGPYIAKLGEDPWGSTYIIHIGAMQKNGCPVGSTGTAPAYTAPATGRQGWIISAGPDGNLDTDDTATQLGGDDLGYIFFTQ